MLPSEEVKASASAPRFSFSAWLRSWWLRLARKHESPVDRDESDDDMGPVLDRLLVCESSALRERTATNPLAFQPSEYVRPRAYGIGWPRAGGNVEIVRTVRAAMTDGYRVRVRAFARNRRGRMIVRSVEVDLKRPV